jgi:hypothetical protein
MPLPVDAPTKRCEVVQLLAKRVRYWSILLEGCFASEEALKYSADRSSYLFGGAILSLLGSCPAFIALQLIKSLTDPIRIEPPAE